MANCSQDIVFAKFLFRRSFLIQSNIRLIFLLFCFDFQLYSLWWPGQRSHRLKTLKQKLRKSDWNSQLDFGLKYSFFLEMVWVIVLIRFPRKFTFIWNSCISSGRECFHFKRGLPSGSDHLVISQMFLPWLLLIWFQPLHLKTDWPWSTSYWSFHGDIFQQPSRFMWVMNLGLF